MLRTSKLKLNGLVVRPALALALFLVACSAAPTGPGGSPTDNGAATGDASTASTSSGGDNGGTASGGASGGGSGGSTATGSSSGSKGGSSGSSSGSTTTTANGGSSGATGIPTAPGITAGPGGGTTLAAPPAADGMQFETPDMAYSVAPNQEIFPNFCVTVPSTIQVGAFQSWMSLGSSHHFILYKGGTAPAGGACTLGANTWMYASSTPGQVITENMPANVGLQIAGNTQLILNMHFINTGSTTLYPKIKVNLLFAQNVMYQAGTMVSFNSQINVPAATANGPGTQTVSGTCTAPAGSKFFTMSTHTHKHATAAWIDYVHAGTTTEVVHTGTTATYPTDQEQGSGVDWEHPGVGLWVEPNFLTIASGDTFTYHCSYSNSASTAVTVGETAASNEMCMAIGYYFPAGSASCR